MKANVLFNDDDDVATISLGGVRETSQVIARPKVSSIRPPHFTSKVQLNEEEALIQKIFSNTSVLAYDERTNKSDVTQSTDSSSRESFYWDDSLADNNCPTNMCSPCRQAEAIFLKDDMTLSTIESEDLFDMKTFFSSLRLSCFTISSAPRKTVTDQIKHKEFIPLKSESIVSATPLTRATRLKFERAVDYEDSNNSIFKGSEDEEDNDTHDHDTQEGEEVILKNSDVIVLDSTILIFDKNVNQMPQRKDNHVDNPLSLSGTKQSKNEEKDVTKSKSFSSTNPETKDERLIPLAVDIDHKLSSEGEENSSATFVLSILTDDNSTGKLKPSKLNKKHEKELRYLRHLRTLSQRHVAESSARENSF